MSENASLESTFRLVHTFKRQLTEQVENLDNDIAPMHMRVIPNEHKAQSTKPKPLRYS